MPYLLTHLVDRAADRDPDHVAATCTGARITYGELARSSDRLARALVEAGVRKGSRVALHLRKGISSVVALYGIMKAGAAYVPLDPTAPATRLGFILRDCGIRHLITDPAGSGVIRTLLQTGTDLDAVFGIDALDGIPVFCIPWNQIESLPAAVPGTGATERDLAYILYTSGSTGVPKGVMHSHRSALSFAEIAAETYGFSPSDRLGNHAPLHFDLSTLDYFAAAAAGATTIIIPETYAKLPASLSALMEAERMTVFYAVPYAMTQLLLRGALEKRDLQALRWMLFGGEHFPPKHLRALMARLPHASFSNVYGPTETNGVTYYVVPHRPVLPDDPVPIGELYGNVEARVVDERGEPVQHGEPGELLIRSASTMWGYWGRPDLDDRAFVRLPSAGGVEDRFYRTGDVVRQDADGLLHLLGRKDRQVKVRGYRVELDEIEAALLTHSDVESAAAFLEQENREDARIEAAVVLRLDAHATAADLDRHARARLPVYAVPSQITIADRFPRTSTGKIDRLRLKANATDPLTA